MPKVPKQFFIVPDPTIRIAEQVPNGVYPYEGGAYVGSAVASNSNSGDLQGFGTGTPTTSFTDTTIRIQNGGNIGASSYIWKETGEADSTYHGSPDMRALRDCHTPDLEQHGYGATAFYVAEFDREVLVFSNNQYKHRVQIYYRAVSSNGAQYEGGETSWTETTIDLEATFGRGLDFSGNFANDGANIDATVMKSGLVVIAVQYQYDVDIYTTRDGLTWDLKSQGILSRFLGDDPFTVTEDVPRTYGRRGLIYSLKIASSGDFLRLVYASRVEEDDAYYLKVLSSSDRGGTWKLVQDDIPVEAGGVVGRDRFGIELVGIENGQFMFAYQNQYHIEFKFWIAQGSGAFTHNSSLSIWWNYSIGANVAPRIYLCRGTDYLWALVSGDIYSRSFGYNEEFGNFKAIGYSGELNLFYIPLGTAIAQGSQWVNMGYKKSLSPRGEVTSVYNGITGLRGLQRYGFCRGRLFNRGDSIAFFGGLFDAEVGPMEGQTSPVYFRLGGWDTRPMNAQPKLFGAMGSTLAQFEVNSYPVAGDALIKGRLFNWLEWRSIFGAPSGILYASRISWLTETRSGATRNWNPNRLRITGYSQSDYLYYEYRDKTDRNHVNAPNTTIVTPFYNLAFYANTSLSRYPYNTGASYEHSQLGTASGSCICFKIKVTDGGQTTYNYFNEFNAPMGAGMQIKSYILSDLSPTNTDQSLTLNIMFDDSGDFQIWDCVGNTELATGSFSSISNFTEVRIGLRPRRLSSGSPSSSSDGIVDVIFAHRTIGTTSWNDTGILQPKTNTTLSPVQLKQSIKFGVFPATDGGPVQMELRELLIHAGTSLGVFDQRSGSSDLVTSMRGKTTSSNESYIRDGVSLVWGGSGGSSGDEFELLEQHSASFENCLRFDSPRIRWSSGQSTNTNNGTIDTTENATERRSVSHNALAVFGTNAKTVSIRYGSGFAGYETISMLRATGRIEEAEYNSFRVSWDQDVPAPTFGSTVEGRKYFGHLTNVQGGILAEDASYVVETHYIERGRRQWLTMAGITQSLTGIVGTTISIYADRGWTTYTPSYGDTDVRIILGGSGINPWEADNTTNEIYAGTVIVGTTLSMDPLEMSWTYSDNDKSNVTLNKTRSGSSWGYREGPTQRTVTGTFQGDVSEQVRRFVRDTMRVATNYDQTGLVFVLYDEDPELNPLAEDFYMLGRGPSSLNFENVGWYYDENEQNWRPVGNLSLTITEIV